jgi:NADH:ubiquinone oxidoreductase subunit 2 (subunit N)
MISAFVTIYTSIIEGMSDNHIGRIIGQSSMINMSFIFIVVLTFVMIQEAFLLYIYVLYLIPTLLLFSLLSLRDIVLDKRNLTVMYDSFISNNYINIALYFTLISLSGLPFLSGFVGK